MDSPAFPWPFPPDGFANRERLRDGASAGINADPQEPTTERGAPAKAGEKNREERKSASPAGSRSGLLRNRSNSQERIEASPVKVRCAFHLDGANASQHQAPGKAVFRTRPTVTAPDARLTRQDRRRCPGARPTAAGRNPEPRAAAGRERTRRSLASVPGKVRELSACTWKRRTAAVESISRPRRAHLWMRQASGQTSV